MLRRAWLSFHRAEYLGIWSLALVIHTWDIPMMLMCVLWNAICDVDARGVVRGSVYLWSIEHLLLHLTLKQRDEGSIVKNGTRSCDRTARAPELVTLVLVLAT